MPEPISNNAFQNWLLNVLEHPGSDDEAWNATQATEYLPFDKALENVLPSKTLAPMERVAIYRRMFFLRMTDAMEIDFPGVLYSLGREAFRRLIANEYIPKHPSTSYTLNHLGKYFPEFLRASVLEHASFLSDLARLELTITDLMDAAEPEGASSVAPEKIAPDAWGGVRIEFIPALELMTFAHAVEPYLTAVENETEPVIPADPQPSWVLVYRQNFAMHQASLSRDEFGLLSALREGQNMEEALEQIRTTSRASIDELEQSLLSWFQRWTEFGIIHRLIPGERPLSHKGDSHS